MTEETRKRANRLVVSSRELEKLQRMMSGSFFNIYKTKYNRKLGFDNVDEKVFFVDFDNITAKELRTAILNVIEKRQAEIENEIKNL